MNARAHNGVTGRKVRRRTRTAALCLLLLVSDTAALRSQSRDGPADLLGRADELIRDKKTGEGVRLLQDALRKNPDWKDGLWRLGSLLYEAQRYPAARQAFEKLTRLDPKAGAPWALLGLCDFGVRDYAASLQHLQRGLSLGFPPELDLAEPVYYHQALALLATGGFDRALVVLLGLSRKQPAQADEFLTAIGLATLRVPALPEAALRLMPPDRAGLLRRLGEIQVSLARGTEGDSRKDWQALVDRHPGVPGLHASLGKLLLEIADLEAAEREFLAELELNPADVTARLGLAVALMQRGSEDSATKRVQEALVLEPQSANGRYLLGLLLFRGGRLEEARRELEISRELDPFLSHVHFTLASVYRQMGRTADAYREHTRFKELSEIENSFRTTGRLPVSVYERATPR